MANAEVYCKWASQNDGDRGQGGWSGPFGSGGITMSKGGGINPLANHAERQAWKVAWPQVRQHLATTQGHFPNQEFEVKIWVDQAVCPACQKWMVVEVLRHLGQIPHQWNDIPGVKLYAEVTSGGSTGRVHVTRTAQWPVQVGNVATFGSMPAVY